ncbi:MAG: histidine phosphatase family protein [Sphingomonas sp.]|nr:histidine phosphatase family protein [Sphingomonas sp.]
MKTLLVLRHAKAKLDSASGEDFDRPLTGRGRRSAEAVGRELQSRRLAFDAVLASPALRVRQTLEIVGQAYGSLPETRFDQELYLADTSALQRKLRLLADEIASVLLVGHNPGLHELLLQLASDEDPLRQQIVGNLPTGAAAILEFPVDRWRDLRPGAADICALVFPRNLDP